MAQAKWADLPEEIKEMMLQEQVAQGNKRDESVFENDIMSGISERGFQWMNSEFEQWDEVIINSNFQTFFARYPKKEQPEKRTMVAIKSDGNKERNLRIIQYLESLGGVNWNKYIGILQNNEFYTIEKDGNIGLMWSPEKYTIIDLPEEAQHIGNPEQLKTEPKANVEPAEYPYFCAGTYFKTYDEAMELAIKDAKSQRQYTIYKAFKTIKSTTTITEVNHE